MNPANLNVSSPTGPFKQAYNQDVAGISNSFRNARGNLAQGMANRGFSSSGGPAYFAQNQANQLAMGEAANKGQAYTTETQNSYNAALQNFWNATNAASGTLGTTMGGSLQGAQNAGSTYGNLYGTSGQPVRILGAGISDGAGRWALAAVARKLLR